VSTYPGFYAIPGAMFPGAIWPGDTLSAVAGEFIFTGTETLTYSQYLDVQAGHTLVAQPGGEYEIEPASGYPYPLPEPPGDGRWISEGN
jgi:hypothetical protein